MEGVGGEPAVGLGRVRRVAIIGTGLLGGSIGLGLRAAGFPGTIVGVGRRLETLQKALALGCVDEIAQDPAAVARDSDLVILATPLGRFAELLRGLAGSDAPGRIITDVGSTKAQVCADARALLPGPAAGRFVGSHPMAGGEQHGPDHARADLFTGRPCVITAEPHNAPSAVATVEALWRTLGMRLVRMSPVEHDEQAARISHLPHVLAVLLVQLAARHGAMEVAATGFRDTTRIASGDPEVWTDIFHTNREAVAAAIDAFAEELARFRALLAAGQTPPLAELLRDAKQQRDAWLQAEGSAST